MTDDLTSIDGVGPTISEALRDVGFETVEDVLEADVDELAEATFVGESTARAILGEDDGNARGRNKQLEEHREAILEAAEKGMTYEGIARVAGVGVSTLREWRNDHPEFNADLERRRAVGESKLIERVAENRPEFILERSYDYVKTEKHEVESDNTHRIEGDGFTVEFAGEE